VCVGLILGGFHVIQMMDDLAFECAPIVIVGPNSTFPQCEPTHIRNRERENEKET